MVSMVTGPLLGTKTSTATLPSRTRKKWSAAWPSRKMNSPGWKTTLATHPTTVSRCGADRSLKKGCSARIFSKEWIVTIGSLALRPGAAARASAVMSMPTGHQVMQRPQPTQPETPNWSCQVASLCVIHCR